jgi:hypothetical protein
MIARHHKTVSTEDARVEPFVIRVAFMARSDFKQVLTRASQPFLTCH